MCWQVNIAIRAVMHWHAYLYLCIHSQLNIDHSVMSKHTQTHTHNSTTVASYSNHCNRFECVCLDTWESLVPAWAITLWALARSFSIPGLIYWRSPHTLYSCNICSSPLLRRFSIIFPQFYKKKIFLCTLNCVCVSLWFRRSQCWMVAVDYGYIEYICSMFLFCCCSYIV